MVSGPVRVKNELDKDPSCEHWRSHQIRMDVTWNPHSDDDIFSHFRAPSDAIKGHADHVHGSACRFGNEPHDAFANAFEESFHSFLFYSSDRVHGHSGYSERHTGEETFARKQE
jgi:hypothetical protein